MIKRNEYVSTDNKHYVMLNKNELAQLYDDMLIKECKRYFHDVETHTPNGGS